jgi:hypothetical protein
MFRRFAIAAAVLFTAALIPASALANARLVSITPTGGACVHGPSGPNVEAWDVSPGASYTVRLDGVTDCANGGTDASIHILIMNTTNGNTPLEATRVATGVYEFTFTMSALACETSPIRYCTAGGNSPNTGLVVGRHDTGTSQAHLRAAEFNADCTPHSTISCVTATSRATWGAIKSIYR